MPPRIPTIGHFARTATVVLGASALALGAGAAAAASGVPATATHGGGFAGAAMIRAAGHEGVALRNSAATSTNWGGYAVTPPAGRVSAVTATFTVPAAGLLLPGFAATWTGVGGYSTPDLIQAGVAEQSLPSTPILGQQYYAWYELLPGGPVHLRGCMGDATCAVGPGDHLSMAITAGAGTQWTIRVVDANRWMYSTNVTYASSNSSAEWILEAPSLLGLQSLLAGVGTAHFGPSSTFTAGGATETIAQGNPVQIDQTAPLGLFHESTTSALAADGQSFNVCAYAQVCAGP